MQRRNSLSLAALLLFVNIAAVFSQTPTVTGSKQDDSQKFYTVAGPRHGISFFPVAKLGGVCYKAGDSLDFKNYHTYDVINVWMQRWAEKYPGLVDLYEVGKSYEGRPIYQMTLTNKAVGKEGEKPAAFFEGGRHSGEVTSSETVMWLAAYLLGKYGNDPEITRILDTRTIYLKPVNNPDGHNLYLNTAQSNRSTVRPFDNDGDGLLDEDAPEDLDNNGIILNMRWKDEKKGSWIPDTTDPTGRLLKRVPAGKGLYLTATEGIDNDGDGKINEDGIGGLDLHRNYTENWRPGNEFSGRGYTQSGSGDYPLSETETRSVVLFLLSHPSVYIVNSMDTSVPMHLRPPSTSPSEERMYPEDLKWYRIFDDIGKKITGYLKAGDVYNDYGNGTPLFGHGPDFGYWSYGAIWYGDEIWNNGRNKDYNGDGTVDQAEILRWDDEQNDSLGFHKWKPFHHPTLGDVEIGGFDPKFFSQNPPARFLETWIKNEALFNLEMVKYLPDMAWEKIDVKKTKAYGKDSTDFTIKVAFRNNGKLPTALKQAYLVKIVREDQLLFRFDTTGIKGKKRDYLVLTGKKPAPEREARMGYGDDERRSPERSYTLNVPFTEGGAVTEAVISIRLYGRSELGATAEFFSTRGGVLKKKEFTIR